VTSYVALLRGINVGGSGKLSMRDLATLCSDCGFKKVKTYIQSGNAVFTSSLLERGIKRRLQAALAKKTGKSVDVMVRTGEEMASGVEQKPVKEPPPNKVQVVFLDKAPSLEAFADLYAPGGEQVHIHGREVYVHYPEGVGRSKLKLPIAEAATGRNLNTVRRLFEMARALE